MAKASKFAQGKVKIRKQARKPVLGWDEATAIMSHMSAGQLANVLFDVIHCERYQLDDSVIEAGTVFEYLDFLRSEGHLTGVRAVEEMAYARVRGFELAHSFVTEIGYALGDILSERQISDWLGTLGIPSVDLAAAISEACKPCERDS